MCACVCVCFTVCLCYCCDWGLVFAQKCRVCFRLRVVAQIHTQRVVAATAEDATIKHVHVRRMTFDYTHTHTHTERTQQRRTTTRMDVGDSPVEMERKDFQQTDSIQQQRLCIPVIQSQGAKRFDLRACTDFFRADKNCTCVYFVCSDERDLPKRYNSGADGGG